MEKVWERWQGLILFLVAQLGVFIAWILNVNKRLMLIESQMTEVRKDLESCQSALTALKDGMHTMETQAKVTEERMVNIASMAKEVQELLRQTMELRRT